MRVCQTYTRFNMNQIRQGIEQAYKVALKACKIMSFYQKKNYHNETLKPLDIVATLFAQNDLDGSNFLLF